MERAILSFTICEWHGVRRFYDMPFTSLEFSRTTLSMNIYAVVKKYTALTELEINTLIEISTIAPPGNAVCAGSWNGGDVMAMSLAFPSREYHVIDSFQGLAAPVNKDAAIEGSAKQGEFNIGGVQRYMQNFEEARICLPHLHELYIDETTIAAVGIDNIALLWMDVDHYTPTKACLVHFGEKMERGGIIMTHDYGFIRCPGVKIACDEYSQNWKYFGGGIWGLTVSS